MHVPPVKIIKKKVESLDLRDIVAAFKPYYIGFLVLFLLISFYHLLFSRRLIPGVYIAGLDLGGFTFDKAVSRLQTYESANEKKITITYGGKSYALTGEEVSLSYNWESTVNRAFEVGRTGNFFVDTKDKLAGLLGKELYIPAYYDLDEEKFDNFMASVRGDLNSPGENAKYFLKNKESLGIGHEHSGQKMNNQEFYDLLIESFDQYNFGSKPVTVEPDEPEVLAADLEKNLTQAEKIVFNPVKLVYEPVEGKAKEWPLTLEQKLELLSFDPIEGDLAFNKVAFRSFLEGVAPDVTKLPRGKVTEVSGDRVLGFTLYEEGIEIDVDKTAEDFKNAFIDLSDKAYVKTKSISGPRDAQQYGIYALLGEGRSKFTGSAQGRINNLTLAASRTDGVLVPPGSIYSFNDAVGEISAATGYDTAWIILGNQTVLGEGGGVCQTSTTMFRAILNAGLPVVVRHPHAYRVYYYEIESPIGIDASVYQPSLDLQFKNDTPNYVLVQSSWDLNEHSLVFRLYGTPDGRKVKISDPVVTNVTGAPPAEYRDDPDLPKGVVKQIDFAAGGANVVFTRQVTRDGEILYDDVFKTNYRPWKAVYLVGTKE